VGCGKEKPPAPAPPVSRLDRHELQKWLDSTFAAGKPVRFFSSNGERMCCEYPNISVEILAEQRIRIEVDGWEPKQYTASYAVENDGKIALVPGGAHPVPRLQGDEITEVYVVHVKSDIVVLERAQPQTNTPVTDRLWPLTFISSGDWRPPPLKSSRNSPPTSVVFPPEARHILPVSLGPRMLHPCSRNVPQATKFWEPSEADIDRLEIQLRAFVAARVKAQAVFPELGSYGRQYIGIILKGKRFIYGNFYPMTAENHDLNVKDVCDGGPGGLWSLVYDPGLASFGEPILQGVI
jgi:hypothetical protein